ncbi:signal peptidase II [Malacoplasma iowae]|uniref:Lipoprotein signal peptidase n=1 Tax=Malacoplasma iowae 695 TaxID=1048830 RepID=A0A6P1LEE6_MALIO|nr:signal peptidase II [Malacoplasma iowae]QHG89808.1 signal peptidase II [Malacoplasma iowae 695]WPL35386.1 signal peptidase II [Malacoplasma iowae]VEU62369.1 Lipoprotein signal peptidase [Mycoplasmopsis fermentans]VEU72392.1 Lipoprotein signal peptidase [Malacoplasma iowae]
MNKKTNLKFKLTINKYRDKIVKQLISIYKTKIWIRKLAIFLGISFLVFLSSFLIRDAILQKTSAYGSFIPGFIDIKVVGNNGVAFSAFENASVSFVYFIQILPIIISMFFLVFTKSAWFDVGFSMIITGGMSNVIDRSIVDVYTHNIVPTEQTINAVVDYFSFSFISGSAIFNMPDVYVLAGVIIVLIKLIVQTIIDYLHYDKENSENKTYENNKEKIIEERR